MARPDSAATIKASALGAKTRRKDAPRPGSQLRELFDLLQSNKGEEVAPLMYMRPDPLKGLRHRKKQGLWTALRQLEVFYGLDIRQRHSGKHGIPIHLILVGEWVGKAYIDYMAAKPVDAIKPLVEIPASPSPGSISTRPRVQVA